MITRRRWLAGALALLWWAAPGAAWADEPLARATVELAGETFSVELADTPAQQAKGLGGRAALGARDGMLFLYAHKGRHSFWMKGMVISIDMIWLDNTRIVHIEHEVPPPPAGVEPGVLPTYASTAPANAVLEIAAGRARALGLRVGDHARVTFDGS